MIGPATMGVATTVGATMVKEAKVMATKVVTMTGVVTIEAVDDRWFLKLGECILLLRSL